MNGHTASTPLLNSDKGSSFPTFPSPSRLTPNVRSPKYLIASPTCGNPLRRSLERGGSPMLNSTVNVSLYTNTQSPGLASRIVQYDRAQNGNSATYNKKFGSPGLFPIVHLYKQSLPVASPKPKRVTVKIAPPDDISIYNRVEHSLIMSEHARIIKIQEQPTNGTRSVLDALKEISRKRIHSSAEFESTSPESVNRKRNKRILESNSTPQLANSTNKRAREESPTDNTPPSVNSTTSSADKNTPKRYCSIDPITASFTSANLRFHELRKAEEYRDDLPESPLRKTQQVSVDTQTNLIEMEVNDPIEQAVVETPIKPQESPKPTAVPVESPLFDPKPLEIIRRNKLAALLGAISGEVPVLETLIDVPREQIAISPPITSILSDGTAGKEPKHVTFDLPAVLPPLVPPNPLMAITQTTTALVMPIPSTMVAPFRDSSASTITTSPQAAVAVHSFTPTDFVAPKTVGGFKFDLPLPSATIGSPAATSAAVLLRSSVDVSAVSTDPPKFGFQFAPPVTSAAVVEPSKCQSVAAVTFTNPTALSTVNFNGGTKQTSAATSSFNFGHSVVSTAADSPKPFTFNAIPAVPVVSIPQKTTQFAEISAANTASTLALCGSTAATTNMFQKAPSDAITSAFGVANSNAIITTANPIGFPLTGSGTTTKFDIASSNNLFTSTNSTTFSFGSLPLASTVSFGSTTDRVPPTFGVNNAVTTAVTTAANIFGSSPFGVAPVVSTSNSTFAGFSGGIKELTQPHGVIKFGETAAMTTANSLNPPATTAPSLFSFGAGGTSTDVQKPPAFNLPKDNVVPNGFGQAKLTFGNFGGNSFGNGTAEVPANQTFSFGNTFAAPAEVTFNKPANFESTFAGREIAPFNATASFSGTTPQQTKLFSFGAATAVPKAADTPLVSVDNKPSGVFAFGTATVKPQATPGGFNFASGVGFGAGTVLPAMFGSPPVAPAFHVGGFNAPTMVGGSPGMFSIGSGSSSGASRPRTQLKTKRRT